MATPPEQPAYSEPMFAAMIGQYAIMQVVVASTALVRNKIVALRLGPSAFGVIAQLGAVIATVMAVVTLGMQVSLSRNVARATTPAERQSYLANANGMVLSVAMLATGALLVFLAAGNLLPVVGLPVTPEVTLAAILMFLAIPLLGLQTNYLSFLQGILDVKGLATQRSVAVLLATVICVPLVWVFGLVGAAANFLVLNALLAVLLGLRCRALGYRWLAVRFNRDVITVLAAFGLASMAAGFSQTFADAAIRSSLIKQYGPDSNGLLQAPLVLAATLQGVVLGSIGTLSLATLSQASTVEATKRMISGMLNVALPLSTVALGLLGLLGVPAMIILYSEQFAGGATLLPWILCAYLIQVAEWVVGGTLLASGDRAIWLTLQMMWSGARLAVTVALLPVCGPVAVGIGMLAANVMLLVGTLITVRLRYQLWIGWGHVAKLLVDTVIVGVLALIGAFLTTSVPAMGAALVIWLSYVAYLTRSTPVTARLLPIAARLRSVLPGR